MLIEFNVSNFLSFKDDTTLSMIGVKSFKEHENDNIIKINSKLKLLKSSVIYGNNASGKSNLIRAVGFMRGFVLNSFRDALLENNDKKIPLTKFLLSTKSDVLPTSFEVVFFVGSVKYRYGFEVEENEVISEWLFHTTSKEVPLFTRNKNEYYINKSSFQEGLNLESKTKNNVLFLTLIAQFNGQISNRVIDWFKNLNIINGIDDKTYRKYTIEKLKGDKDFQKWVNSFIRFLEISKLTTVEEETSRQTKRNRIVTWHRKYGENNLLIDTVPFNFDHQESEGTKKLIYLLGPWYDTLRNSKILVVDELDSRLHTNLMKQLIRFFHATNHLNAQLIFVVHDTNILSKDYFRRDQIWFIEKNQFGASELYSLGDFKSEKVRKKSAFDKNYTIGKYGAVPYFEHNEKLNALLYGEEKI